MCGQQNKCYQKKSEKNINIVVELNLIDCQKINVDTLYFPFDGCLLLSNDMHTQLNGEMQTFCIICGGKITI